MIGCETEDVIKQKYDAEKDLMNLYSHRLNQNGDFMHVGVKCQKSVLL